MPSDIRIPAAFGFCINLRHFEISGQLLGPIPPELGCLVNLKCLILQGNGLNGDIPKEFANLYQLEELMSGLWGLLELKTLCLDSNFGLCGQIPAAIGGLVKLENLRLDKNKLTGPVPSEILLLTRLVECDLSENVGLLCDFEFRFWN
ncbi:hypothetical protein HDU98_006815 [Podochytrium sp. JEL0797]|nr:hypothetical protein HDU98_006815 [Podochytrium sp. JEL0797]